MNTQKWITGVVLDSCPADPSRPDLARPPRPDDDTVMGALASKVSLGAAPLYSRAEKDMNNSRRSCTAAAAAAAVAATAAATTTTGFTFASQSCYR